MTQTTVVSINPDWKSDFGHFGAWDARLGAQCRSADRTFVSLSHQHLPDPPTFARPTFSEVFTAAPSNALLETFETELRSALHDLGGRPVVACMYAGSIGALASVNVVADTVENVRFVVNLMRSHPTLEGTTPDRSPEHDAATRSVLDESIRSGIRVAVDSSALQSRARHHLGVALDVWPMMTTTSDSALRPRDRTSDPAGPIHVVAPVQPQIAKGFDLVLGLCRRLEQAIGRGEVIVTARHTRGIDMNIDRIAEDIRSTGAELIEGNLSVAAYGQLITNADVVVVPYRRSVFRTRTSAVALDAVTAGVPVVTTADTWAAQALQEFGIGTLFEDGDASSLHDAVVDVMSDLPVRRRQVMAVRSAMGIAYSPAKVFDFVTASTPPTGSTLRPERLRELRRGVSSS